MSARLEPRTKKDPRNPSHNAQQHHDDVTQETL